jgi:hypothetical protein
MNSSTTPHAARSAQWLKLTAYAVLFTACCAWLMACAQIVTPDGGPKDATPPRVVKYSPDSAATGFTGRRIVITFDEYIALNELNKQLIISPAVKRRPEVTIRKKDLIIEFKDTLEPNTTYSISFGKAIRDITENNALDNFRFVFSTGPYIDSLKISGTVVNAQTLRGEKNVLVMLYRDTKDSVIYKQKPYYYTRTDDQGNYTLTNLAAAQYKVFALDDVGEDYLYNTPEERIAFSDSLMTLRSDRDSVRLLMFREKSPKQFLARTEQPAPGRFRFVYNQPVEGFSVSYLDPLPANMKAYEEFSASKDSVNIWFSSIELDSVTFVTYSNGKALDTIPMKLQKVTKKPTRAGAQDMRALIISNNGASGKLLPGYRLVLQTTNPVAALDTSKIILRMGADTVRKNIQHVTNSRLLRFDIPFPEDSSFALFIGPGAIKDVYGQKNDTIRQSFIVQSGRSFGNLSVKMPNLAPGKYLVEVVDDKDAVVRDTIINGPATIQFGTMAAGNYRVRLIRDEDGNGIFTPGNYLQNKQAEKVIYYAIGVRVRAGWDMDIEWILQ